jgi:pimeloyl-ACP methyl ester carboxylesterase
LLHAAGVPPPYIVVGHSFGGFNVRVYAGRYRNEVAGMVLVDSSDEAQGPLPESVQAPARRYVPQWLWGTGEVVSQCLVHLGVGRLIDEGVSGSAGAMSDHDSAIIRSLQLQTKAFDMTIREGRDRDESAAQVRGIRSLGDIPLIVLTGAGDLKPPDSESDGDSNDLRTEIGFMRNRVYGAQRRLAALSTRGQQIILPVGHAIPIEAPKAVIDAVGEVLNQTGASAH